MPVVGAAVVTVLMCCSCALLFVYDLGNSKYAHFIFQGAGHIHIPLGFVPPNTHTHACRCHFALNYVC